MGSWSRAELNELIAEAVVDAYDDDEQLLGFFTMIDDHLALPFATTVLGVEVTVGRVDLRARGIVALCHRGRATQAIGDFVVSAVVFRMSSLAVVSDKAERRAAREVVGR